MTVTAKVEIDPRIVGATRALESRVGSVLLGKPAQVRMATAALLSGEHLLLNDLPGVGKTILGTALARVVDGAFGRVQGTPDLLPSDITGSSVFNQIDGSWNFRPGPIMANVVLVDELNRIMPRSQSALLEAMAEGAVTVDGVTRSVPVPFMVVATMNPMGLAGTFPLTIGQLDRFGAAVGLGPVDRDTERSLLQGVGGPPAVDKLRPVLPADLIPQLQIVVSRVYLADLVVDYVLDICEAVRSIGHLSTRAPRSIVNLAQATAVLDGRNYVIPDDVKVLAGPVLRHRIVVAPGAEMEGVTADDLVPRLLDQVAAPR